MAIYFVGDVHGCFAELQALLAQAQFDKTRGHLYFTGDLVARGPDSLSVLRFVKSLGDHGHAVLGNHDLHLLAVGFGLQKEHPADKISPILQAPDKLELLGWLRTRPLLIHKAIKNHCSPGFVLTHAGIAPAWDLAQAKSYAHEAQQLLRGEQATWLLQNMYGNEPAQWSDTLTGIARYRYIFNAFTRMRFCTKDGALDLTTKETPAAEQALIPWFLVENSPLIAETRVFGHWAALGGYFSDRLLGVDTGCVWNGALTMVRWEDSTRFTQQRLS
ncbi:MAG: symmetrical bis(5'-nucleosyl)-tetraphosphatase [Vibrionaceae bacterium]